jgi:hypothetical protein
VASPVIIDTSINVYATIRKMASARQRVIDLFLSLSTRLRILAAVASIAGSLLTSLCCYIGNDSLLTNAVQRINCNSSEVNLYFLLLAAYSTAFSTIKVIDLTHSAMSLTFSVLSRAQGTNKAVKT